MDEKIIQNEEQKQDIQVQEQEQQSATIFDRRMNESARILNDTKGTNNADSDEMKAVKGHLTQLTNVLKEQANDGRNLSVQIAELKDHYTNLIAACDHYLETKWTAKYYFFGTAHRRRKMVAALRDMALAEKNCLSGLSKDKEFQKKRVEGDMVGTALSSALRDYQAIKEDYNLKSFKKEGNSYEKNVRDLGDTFSQCVVNLKAGVLDNATKGGVCAGRFAKFIGMDGIMRRTNLIVAKNAQGNVHYGIRLEGLSEEATSDLASIREAQKKRPYKVTYSGEALRQISNAKIFHLLLNGKNLNMETDIIMIFNKVDIEDETVYQVTGAYLDVPGDAFSEDDSLGTMEKLFQKRDFLMDSGMAETILQMDTNDLEYVGGEMLSKKQRAAFEKRLNFMKNWVQTTKQREAENGPSQLLEKDMWSDTDNLTIIKRRMQNTENGMFKGVLNQNSMIEETDAENISDVQKEYRQLYKKVKENLESTKDPKERVMIISGLFETIPFYEKKFQIRKATDFVTDIQARLISEYANDELLLAYHKLRIAENEKLADAYREEKKQNPNNKNAEYDTVNDNLTTYRNIMLLTHFGKALVSANLGSRDLRFNRTYSHTANLKVSYLESLGDGLAKVQEDDKISQKLTLTFEKADKGNKHKEYLKQIASWAQKEYLVNPRKSLKVQLRKIEEKDEIEAAIPKDAHELRRCYAALKSFKSNVLPQPPVYNGDPNDAQALSEHRKAEKAYRDEIVNTGLLFMHFYQVLKTELSKQADETKSRALTDYYNVIYKESILFTNIVTTFLSEHQTYKKNTTWDDVIRKGTKLVFRLDNVKNLGAGTSDVYKLGIKNKNLYFKPKEDLALERKNIFVDIAQKELNKALENKQLTEAEKEGIKLFEQKLEEYLIDDYSETFHENEALYYNIVMKPAMEYHGKASSPREKTREFYKKACYGEKKVDLSKLSPEEKAEQSKIDSSYKKIYKEITQNKKMWVDGKKLVIPAPGIFAFFEYLQTNKEKLSKTCINQLRDMTVNILTNFTFKLNQFEVSTGNAKIKPGRNVSERNVATSRMADLLGFGRLVAHSEHAIGLKGGNYVVGNLMDEAQGEMIKRVGKKIVGNRFVPEKQKYTLNAIKDINTMRIFDILTGQVDRHEENFHYITHMQGNTKMIDTVQMIDNDMAFGTLTVKDIKEGRGVAMPYDREELRALPNEVLEKLRAMDINAAKLIVGDILDEEELAALDERLKFIQSEIREIDKEQQQLLDSEKEEDLEKAFFMQDDDYRALMFVNHAREKLKKDVKDPDDNRFRPIASAGLPLPMMVSTQIKNLKAKKNAEFLAWKAKHLEARKKDQNIAGK